MTNKIAITMPPGIDFDDIEKLCRGAARWCDRAQDHDLTQQVTIIVTGGPSMTRSELVNSVRRFIPTSLAESVHVTAAVAQDLKTPDGSQVGSSDKRAGTDWTAETPMKEGNAAGV